MDACPLCEREYVALIEATLEDQDTLMTDLDLPPADLSFLPPLPFDDYVRTLIRDVVQRQLPHRLADLEYRLGPLLRQMAAFADGPILSLAPTLSAGQELPRIAAATYDTLRAISQQGDGPDLAARVRAETLPALLQIRDYPRPKPKNLPKH